MDEQNRNLLLATALSFAVILVWFVLFPPPEAPVNGQDATTTSAEPAPGVVVPDVAAPSGDATLALPGATSTDAAPVAEAPRIAIETPSLSGSISLRGARIDDLALTKYNETLDPGSDAVTLFAPETEQISYYAVHGWAPAEGVTGSDLPGLTTEWQAPADAVLTPETPVTLTWDNGAGLVFTRTIAVDGEYLFTITQSVENATASPVALAQYGALVRHSLPDLRGFFILHEGAVGMQDGELIEGGYTYRRITDLDVDPGLNLPRAQFQGIQEGWIGFTDQYWMTNLIPSAGTSFDIDIFYQPSADIYQTQTVSPAVSVAPGEVVSVETRLFAGAKEWETIRSYQNDEGIEGFLDSIDWGWFFFLTKPIFALLHWINVFIGNMGWSIILLTLVIKAALLPLAFRSYVSMAKMKELQPEMEKLKERTGDDRQELQKGMMELYRKNKVNPASGCLPILLQIPIFFSLYKVIFVTIELRHAAWIGWIKDLSAPDPSSILNLFGLLPYSTPEPGSLFFIFSLGVLPILLGISMWLQQKLNPAPPDPTQRMIFAWMPWIFMFMLGGFASGLVLYWIANNTITFIQQYAIMRSQGFTPDVFGNIRESFKRRTEAQPAEKPKAKGDGDKDASD